MNKLFNHCKQFWPLVAICLFLMGIGCWLIIGGSINGVVGAGGHQLTGWERLLGLIPIAIGAFLLWVSYPQGGHNNGEDS